MKNLLVLGIVVLSGVFNVQAKDVEIESDSNIKFPPQGDLISVEDLQNDVAELKTLLSTVHPEPSFTMDITEVELRLDQLTEAIAAPMTQLEAWQHFSLMNPFFNDGHMLISYPEYNQRLNVSVTRTTQPAKIIVADMISVPPDHAFRFNPITDFGLSEQPVVGQFY